MSSLSPPGTSASTAQRASPTAPAQALHNELLLLPQRKCYKLLLLHLHKHGISCCTLGGRWHPLTQWKRPAAWSPCWNSTRRPPLPSHQASSHILFVKTAPACHQSYPGECHTTSSHWNNTCRPPLSSCQTARPRHAKERELCPDHHTLLHQGGSSAAATDACRIGKLTMETWLENKDEFNSSDPERPMTSVNPLNGLGQAGLTGWSVWNQSVNRPTQKSHAKSWTGWYRGKGDNFRTG